MSSVQAAQAANPNGAGMGLESVNKLSQLPVVESTIGMASDMYKKMKVSNCVIPNPAWPVTVSCGRSNSNSGVIGPLASGHVFDYELLLISMGVRTRYFPRLGAVWVVASTYRYGD